MPRMRALDAVSRWLSDHSSLRRLDALVETAQGRIGVEHSW